MHNALPILALAMGSTALSAPTAEHLTSCITDNAAHLASFSDCADPEILTHCLSTLDAPFPEYISSCHLEAGCPSASAASDTSYLLSRCRDIVAGADLRKREHEAAAAHPRFAAITVFPRAEEVGAKESGDACLTTSTIKTSTCDLETNGGQVSSVNCRESSAARSACKPGKTCSMDSTGTDICMDLKNSLDIAGIIIAIVFGSAITIGIGALTFLCCKDRKEQKRLMALSEAKSLARAATKKKRAADLRQPLMAQAPAHGPDTSALGGGGGAGDPFHDANRS